MGAHSRGRVDVQAVVYTLKGLGLDELARIEAVLKRRLREFGPEECTETPVFDVLGIGFTSMVTFSHGCAGIVAKMGR